MALGTRKRAAKRRALHLLAHVPAGFYKRLKRLQLRWLRSITGRPYKECVICSKPIGRRLGIELSNPEFHAANLVAAFNYVLKGVCPKQAIGMALPKLQAGGRVIGRRCSTSQNIGRKARSQTIGSVSHGN